MPTHYSLQQMAQYPAMAGQPATTAAPPGAMVQMPQQFAPAQVAGDTMNAIVDPRSAYIQNARRRGMEFAQSRGGLNTSIAAGAAERAAIEAAQPLASQAMQLQGQREQAAQQQFMQQQEALAQDWLAENAHMREFTGTLAMLPITSSLDMLQAIQQYSLADPALYTPEVVSGMSNFFTTNMRDILSRIMVGG